MSLSVNIVKLGLDLILKNFTTILWPLSAGHIFSGWAVSYPLTEE